SRELLPPLGNYFAVPRLDDKEGNDLLHAADVPGGVDVAKELVADSHPVRLRRRTAFIPLTLDQNDEVIRLEVRIDRGRALEDVPAAAETGWPSSLHETPCFLHRRGVASCEKAPLLEILGGRWMLDQVPQQRLRRGKL